MLPSSHQAPMMACNDAAAGQRPEAGEGALLAEAFSDFIAASTRLELSYRDLQAEVAELSQALGERNRALADSLSENKRMGDRLERILDTIPCGVLVLDADGSVQLANPEAERLLALSAEHTLSALADRFGHPTHPGAEAENAEQELLFEAFGQRHWVAGRWVELPGSRPASGRAEAMLILRDISARKRMETEREAARDTVALAQVSALLAHEIRNPLASLELFAGLLDESGEQEAEQRAEWLSHLRAGIRSLSCTVNNVLTLHGNAALPLERVDVLSEAKLAVEFLQPMARQAEVRLGFLSGYAGQANSLQILASRGSLRQVLLNLCCNALRHTPPGGTVEVVCYAPVEATDPLRLAVVDTGCGIPPQDLPHLFEPGFSGSGATSGLGLAVCQRLLQPLGALLRVESRVGHGSTFTLEFPRA